MQVIQTNKRKDSVRNKSYNVATNKTKCTSKSQRSSSEKFDTNSKDVSLNMSNKVPIKHYHELGPKSRRSLKRKDGK